jgi:hypothetical protein
MWIATAIHIISHENGRLVAFDSGNTTHCIKKYTATPYKRLPPPRVPPEISSTGWPRKILLPPHTQSQNAKTVPEAPFPILPGTIVDPALPPQCPEAGAAVLARTGHTPPAPP